ncbi:hypothetical protein LX36DRAFT_651711 [Colletotrichum falcatum]|nr:hypothetical protein LX36DRAFT_651711 [Colletotrichum falcatum]
MDVCLFASAGSDTRVGTIRGEAIAAIATTPRRLQCAQGLTTGQERRGEKGRDWKASWPSSEGIEKLLGGIYVKWVGAG